MARFMTPRHTRVYRAVITVTYTDTHEQHTIYAGPYTTEGAALLAEDRERAKYSLFFTRPKAVTSRVESSPVSWS